MSFGSNCSTSEIRPAFRSDKSLTLTQGSSSVLGSKPPMPHRSRLVLTSSNSGSLPPWYHSGPDGTLTGLNGVSSTFRLCIAVIQRSRYSRRVKRSLADRTRKLTWLLCVLFAIFSFDSPHCATCDGLPLVGPVSKSFAHQHVPAKPDACNGACSCCLLQGLPIAPPILASAALAQISGPFARPIFAVTRPSAIFRPPRVSLS